MSYDNYKAFERSMLDSQFDVRNSLELLAQTHPDSLYETIKNVMHTANYSDVDRVQLTERMFEVVTLRHQEQRVAKPLYLRLLLAYGPVLNPDQLKKLMGEEEGVFKFEVADLNQSFEGVYMHPALAISLNARHPVNGESIGYICKRLWGWYAFEDNLIRQVGRCENPEVVGAMLEHEPFALSARQVTLQRAVLEDPRVLAHVITHKAYKSSDAFRVLSAGIRTPDPALFQAALDAVSGWSRDESTYYMQHASAQVMCVLLNKDFRGATGVTKERVAIADSIFSEIGNGARKGREEYLSPVGLSR